MPKYKYTAKSKPQRTIHGDIEAESEQDAINRLTKKGLFPLSVSPEDLSPDNRGLFSFKKITNKDIVLFTRQLSILIESGVNIITSFGIIIRQIPNPRLKAILNDVASQLKDGRSLSESLAEHPKVFFPLYTSMIHSGEVGGNIEQTLKRLAGFLEKEEEFKNSIRAALTYPLFILVIGALTVILLLTFVIPRLVSMFEDMGQILPLPTKILISASEFLQNNWWLILAVIIISIFALRRISCRPQGKSALDRFKLKLPKFGEIILKTEISRLMRTLSLLLLSGTPIISSLDISLSIVDNQILKLELQKYKERIAEGWSFSKCLNGSKLFPQFVTNIVSIAEETGTLEKSLMRIADDYEKEVDRTLKAFTRLLEPVIILAMGLIVGFIVISILLPIFQINLIVK